MILYIYKTLHLCSISSTESKTATVARGSGTAQRAPTNVSIITAHSTPNSTPTLRSPPSSFAGTRSVATQWSPYRGYQASRRPICRSAPNARVAAANARPARELTLDATQLLLAVARAPDCSTGIRCESFSTAETTAMCSKVYAVSLPYASLCSLLRICAKRPLA